MAFEYRHYVIATDSLLSINHPIYGLLFLSLFTYSYVVVKLSKEYTQNDQQSCNSKSTYSEF